MAVSFSTVCLTGPVIRVFLVSRNLCVLGHLLNSVLGAEAWQVWQYSNNYKPSPLSPLLILVQYTILLTVSASVSHRASLSRSTTSLVCLRSITEE